MTEFLRLEKIVFGDIKGQALTDLVAAMYTEFNDLLNAFQGKGGDPLDLSTTVSIESHIAHRNHCTCTCTLL